MRPHRDLLPLPILLLAPIAHAQLVPSLGTQSDDGSTHAAPGISDSYSLVAPDPLASWSPPHQSISVTAPSGAGARVESDYASTIGSRSIGLQTAVSMSNSWATGGYLSGYDYAQRFDLTVSVTAPGVYRISGELWRQSLYGWNFSDPSVLAFGQSGQPPVLSLRNDGSTSNTPVVVTFPVTELTLSPGSYTVHALDQSSWGGDPSQHESHMTFSLALACYANCDASTAPPVLAVNDFTCFLQRFASGNPYANCDGSTAPPVLNVADFTCFLQSFAAGCP